MALGPTWQTIVLLRRLLNLCLQQAVYLLLSSNVRIWGQVGSSPTTSCFQGFREDPSGFFCGWRWVGAMIAGVSDSFLVVATRSGTLRHTPRVALVGPFCPDMSDRCRFELLDSKHRSGSWPAWMGISSRCECKSFGMDPHPGRLGTLIGAPASNPEAKPDPSAGGGRAATPWITAGITGLSTLDATSHVAAA